MSRSATFASQLPAHRASVSRSAHLFRVFLREQSDPDLFYQHLAGDAVSQLGSFVDLGGKTVLDVGGGPGYFAVAFRTAGARYVMVDSDVGELSARVEPGPTTVLGSGTALPFRDHCVDVCYSSNLLEHVAEPERAAEEMVRVTVPGGIVFLSYTTWYSPWGGHEASPWHYFGGRYAARRYRAKHGYAPKNEFGRTLFPLTVARMLRWGRRQRGAMLVRAFPRYHPWWLQWTVRVPAMRELATWNLVLVLRVR